MRAHRHGVLVCGNVCELHDALNAGAIHALGSQVHQHLPRHGAESDGGMQGRTTRCARTRWLSVPPVTSVYPRALSALDMACGGRACSALPCVHNNAHRVGHAHLAVAQHLLLVRLELGAGSLLQRNRQAGDGVVVRAALRAACALLPTDGMR